MDELIRDREVCREIQFVKVTCCEGISITSLPFVENEFDNKRKE